ncbi:MAG: 1-acyl-sn-glycerol-3-phosphate acyltransferase [Bacteroidales bacterium]|jgi:1-acyl-sn-glycerol-3-phosphate acyltransferase|nr:1-acyl-sn-glycerol-3-phosphate acyltransferase [Bacteroidales bacterium]
MHEEIVPKTSFFYRMFRFYVRLLHDYIYYKKTYSFGIENLPADGTPLIIASNHQNCLCDALAILYSGIKRKPYYITRADAFEIKGARKFFIGLGLLPAYRLDFEGETSLKNNLYTFELSQQYLLKGTSIVIFPEAGHQDKHYLGNFSLAYLRMAFDAAQRSDFKENIYILPACNHYSQYFPIREEVLVKFGKPIALQPYYDLYQTKPRTAQRQINELVRQQINDMMLNINDLDNYKAIDFLRNHFRWCRNGGKMGEKLKLPKQLEIDKRIFACLEFEKIDNEQNINQLYKNTTQLETLYKQFHIQESDFHKKTSCLGLCFQILLALICLPLWIVSLFPAVFIYQIPRIFNRMMPDIMFESTFRIAIMALFTIPLFLGATVALIWIFTKWWIALLFLVASPAIALFSWYYVSKTKAIIRQLRLKFLKKSAKFKAVTQLRETVCTDFANCINKIDKK